MTPAFVEREQPPIRDRDAMGIAGQIGEHRRGSGEGALGIDHPFASTQWREPLGEPLRVGERRVLAEELQSASAVCLVEFFEEAAAKQARKHAHRQEEARLAGNPTLAVER